LVNPTGTLLIGDKMTEQEYESAVKDKNIVVQFSANWCGPCKTVTPILENLTSQIDVEYLKIDIGESPELARKLGIRSIPHILYVKNGLVEEEVTGARSSDHFLKLLKENYG
jgi:thioredoxin 1